MKETVTIPEEPSGVALLKKAGPQGIGMAVAFDWGLAVQVLTMSFISFLLGVTTSLQATLVSFLVSLPFAILIAIFGEGIRRGWRWTRPVQVVFNSLGFIGGLFTLVMVWNAGQHGNYWPIATAVILLIFSPLIAWRLSRPVTGRWFATVSSLEARRRHGGMWPIYIALWAIIGGLLQAMAALSK